MVEDPLARFLAGLRVPIRSLPAAEVDAELARLRAVVERELGEGAAARFVVPGEFRRFLILAGGGQLEHHPSFSSLSTIVSNTALWIGMADKVELFDEGIFANGGPLKEKEEPEDGPWIHFASYGDKHWLFLCCDREHPEFGHVAEGYDSTPWLFAPSLDFNMNLAFGDDWDDPAPPEARWTFPQLLAFLAAQAGDTPSE